MNAYFQSRFNMYRAVQQTCNEYSQVLQTIPFFAGKVAELNATMSAIRVLRNIEDRDTTGVAADKSTDKTALCELAADMGAQIFAYAVSTGNETLKSQVDYSVSDLL